MLKPPFRWIEFTLSRYIPPVNRQMMTRTFIRLDIQVIINKESDEMVFIKDGTVNICEKVITVSDFYMSK
ncbi:MAG: hypothetical protein ABRQ37_25780 [Candidatus Eremiobacterota bacterium]